MVKKALLKLLRIVEAIFLIVLLFVIMILLRNEFKRINQVKEFTKNNPDIVQLCKNKYQSNIYYYKYESPKIYIFKVNEKLFLKYNSKNLSERELYKEIVIELINADDKHFLKNMDKYDNEFTVVIKYGQKWEDTYYYSFYKGEAGWIIE